ncbi:MAG: hypothetical protein ABIQ88_23555 [Chitinophagaceae bacterium]
MKRILNLLCITVIIALAVSFNACKKFEADTLPMTPIDLGGKDSYASLEENSVLTIPIKFTSPSDSGIASAAYKVVNNRAGEVLLAPSPLIPIGFHGKTVDTTITVPVRLGLIAVVIIIYDKAGRLSSKSVDIKSIIPSKKPLKTLTDVVMSTDPTDNKNFFSFYEPTPVFGSSVALTKQSRVDLLLVNMAGARFISSNAYGASAAYYTAAQPALAGFNTLTYAFLSATKTYLNRANFDPISTEEDLARYLNDSVLAITPKGGAYYNIINADRRVSDVYGVSPATKGFIIGWGYRSHPNATAVILNEAFALILIKSVTQKPNGNYIVTFDIKGRADDQRASYNATPITPYAPYPL